MSKVLKQSHRGRFDSTLSYGPVCECYRAAEKSEKIGLWPRKRAI
jgi:hypothetical protein